MMAMVMQVGNKIQPHDEYLNSNTCKHPINMQKLKIIGIPFTHAYLQHTVLHTV